MLSELKPLRRWVEDGDGGDAFNQYHKIDWFIRNHRDELLQTETLFPGSGGRPTLVSPVFSEAVEKILKREAVALA
jgi:hypothetical protein